MEDYRQGRNALREVLLSEYESINGTRLGTENKQAHHIIPVEVMNELKIECSKEDFNSTWNGILLSTALDEGFQHYGSHTGYTNFVLELITEHKVSSLAELKDIALIVKLSIYNLGELNLTISGLRDAIIALEQSCTK